MKCHECIFFTDLGACRNGRSGRKDVGYFDNACPHGEPKDKNKNRIIMNEKETTTAPATQVCKGCGRELPLEEFQKGPHGYMNFCKECFKKRQKEGRNGTKSETEPEHVGTKSAAEKLEELYLEMNAREIIAKIKNLSQELRRRGYEVTGTICTKIEI